MKRILVKIPTRGRAKQCGQVIRAMMNKSESHCEYLVSIDKEEDAPEDVPDTVRVINGVSESKIHAINRDINECTYPWDILVVGSDDMWPVKKGWDTIIREGFERHLPDLDGMLWFPDGYQKRISTMPVMGRTYYSRFRHVYRPEYRSFFCDNEQTEIAQAHGKMIYIDDQLFDHRHPDNGVKGVTKDETYRKADTDWDHDKLIYQRRRLQGFPQ